MNEELIQTRLDTIETKLDKLTELTQQTALQEYRLTKLEDAITRMQEKKEGNLWKVLTPVFSTLVAAVMSWLISGGLK